MVASYRNFGRRRRLPPIVFFILQWWHDVKFHIVVFILRLIGDIIEWLTALFFLLGKLCSFGQRHPRLAERLRAWEYVKWTFLRLDIASAVRVIVRRNYRQKVWLGRLIICVNIRFGARRLGFFQIQHL